MWSLTMCLQKELQEYVLTRLLRWKGMLAGIVLDDRFPARRCLCKCDVNGLDRGFAHLG